MVETTSTYEFPAWGKVPLKDSIENVLYREAYPTVKKELEVKYYDKGETYHTSYERYIYDDLLHCPHCGYQGIWIKDGERDLCEGPPHICTNCGADFYIPILNHPPTADEQVRQRITQLIAI